MDPDSDDDGKELLGFLWPEVEPALTAVMKMRAELQEADEAYPSDSKKECLTLLSFLRRTILQDFPFLQKEFPDHPTWKHEMFSSPAWHRWSARVVNHVKESHALGSGSGAIEVMGQGWAGVSCAGVGRAGQGRAGLG